MAQRQALGQGSSGYQTRDNPEGNLAPPHNSHLLFRSPIPLKYKKRQKRHLRRLLSKCFLLRGNTSCSAERWVFSLFHFVQLSTTNKKTRKGWCFCSGSFQIWFYVLNGLYYYFLSECLHSWASPPRRHTGNLQIHTGLRFLCTHH